MALVHTVSSPIVRIDVRLKVGDHLMAATDDPVFLELRGPTGREFRLLHAHGKSFRRGQEDHFVLAAPESKAANVASPEFNDPTRPVLDAASLSGVRLRKGSEPIPNVRAFGEMDDRLEIHQVGVEIHTANESAPLRFGRSGPLWLGLICGLSLEIGPAP